MCGIFGYVGQSADTGTLVLEALRKLEYRGYDSWGVGVSVNGHISIEKEIGKIGATIVDFPDSTIGFGHTRWATHGGVTHLNAHPHTDSTGRIAIIHNGIIENHQELRSQLIDKGYLFRSATDSEIFAHLVYDNLEGAVNEHAVAAAVFKSFNQLEGLNAFIVMDHTTSTLTAIKNVSPLVLGRGRSGVYIASDQIALAGLADDVSYISDGQVVQLTGQDAFCFNEISNEFTPLYWSAFEFEGFSSTLNGFPHFLIKEIFEQPEVIERLADPESIQSVVLADEIRHAYGTFFVGCGTASYAALSGSYLFSRIAKHHVNFVVGSEFGYQEHFLTDRSLVAALSQSGETADIIQSILSAKERDARIAALVNVKNSTLDRIADVSMYLEAGPELCVLSTKAYTAKVALLMLTAYHLAGDPRTGQELLRKAADGIRSLLSPGYSDRIIDVAQRIVDARSMFVIGRGLSYPTALEAALKIKEVSYIHAEGFAGGELKHGVIALIEEGTPCLVFAPEDETRADIISGATELKSRGGLIIGVSSRNDEIFDIHLPVPDAGNANPLVMIVPAQLLGYQLALLKDYDPDKPRNLAKSVTVK